MTQKFGLLAILMSGIWLIYGQVWYHDFVGLDDSLYINQHTRQGLSWQTLVWAFTNVDAYNWQPITWLSHLLDIELFGLWPGGHHLTNVLLHTLNTGLLFGWLQSSTRQTVLSFWVAVLFAIHPVHVESVAWVAERKDVLSLFWGLLALMAYSRYTRTQQPGWCGMSFLLLALGLMSKAMLVTWPFLFLLLDYWPLQRMTAAGGWYPVWRLVREKIPFFLLVAVFALITLVAQQGAMATIDHYGLLARLENSLLAVAMYLYKTLLPYHLAVYYPHASIRSAAWVAGVVAMSLLLITGVVLAYTKRAAYLVVGWLWFLGTLVPVIGLVQVGQQFTADRYLYIPQIGLAIMLVWGLNDGLKQGKIRPLLLKVGTLAVVLALSFAAWRQVGYWRDDVSLFSHAVRVVPRNDMAHTLLGIAWFRREQWQPAEFHLLQAMQISPQHYSATYLAKIAEQQQQPAQAQYYYQQALQWVPQQQVPDRVNILENYANFLLAQQQIPQARIQLEALLQLKPDHASARAALKRLNDHHNQDNSQ